MTGSSGDKDFFILKLEHNWNIMNTKVLNLFALELKGMQYFF